MQNTITNNHKLWNDDYGWPRDGDEWDGQAIYCGIPYESWKNSLIKTLVLPNIKENSVVLEIAPGHGRWSKSLVEYASSLILVDISPSCIAFCKELFYGRNNISYHVNNGLSLAGIDDHSVDFIWSYDSFVHMNKAVIGSYLSEIARVLRPGGKAIIHHPGRNRFFLWLGFTRHWGIPGMHFYKMISMSRFKDHDGWRSNISNKTIRKLATKNGLRTDRQIQYWDQDKKVGTPRFNDCITILSIE